MTVNSQVSKVTANGNGTATVFSFSPMVIHGLDDLLVVTNTAGVETIIDRGSSSTTYSVNITNFPSTGSITYPAVGGTPLGAGSTITIKRLLTLEQPTDLENQGGYLPEVQEDQLDKIVMMILQQQEEINRSLNLPITYAGAVSPDLPVPVAGQYIRVNAGGTAFEFNAVSDGAQGPQGPEGPQGPQGPAGENGTGVVDSVTATAPIASSGGANPVISLNNSGVTYAKIQNISATDKLLGRATAGAGVIEEIACTAAGRALLDDASASAQRTTLGLNTMATQAASAVAITGGSVTGINDITVADGGTGASDAATARTNLGLNTMATQAASAVAITGGTISGVPVSQNSKSADYTLVIGDAGKHILHPSADTTARVFTIPANSSVAFPVGTVITFVNQNAAGVITIAITTDTMRLSPGGTTGSRTLAANGVATALKLTSTEWIISGTGLS